MKKAFFSKYQDVEVIVPAESPAEAKCVVFHAAKDAGWEARYFDIRVKVVPCLAEWAQTAAPICWGPQLLRDSGVLKEGVAL